MKTLIIVLWMLLLIPNLFGAVTVTAGQKISGYPSKTTPTATDMFIMEQVSPNTNRHITFLNLSNAIAGVLSTLSSNQIVQLITNRVFVAAGSTNVGIVTNYGSGAVTYTIYATNDGGGGGAGSIIGGSNLGSGVGVVIDTNANLIRFRSFSTQGSAISIGTNGNDIIITNIALTPTEVTNFVLAVSNSLAGSVSGIQINQYTTNVANTPILGSFWFQGTNGTFVTNGSRTTVEWIPIRKSFRVGTVGPVNAVNHNTLFASNYWDAINMGWYSIAFGSNTLAHGDYSTVAGGFNNLIYTNATSAFIGGGSGNAIRTNAHRSVISGGLDNIIHINAIDSFIGGGQGHLIYWNSTYNAIVGGNANAIYGTHSFIGGGNNNAVASATATLPTHVVVVGGNANVAESAYSTIGGGNSNKIQDSSDSSTIAGGSGNNVGDAPSSGTLYAAIGGGLNNLVHAGADYSVIAGGSANDIASNSKKAIIVGGENNSVTTSHGFVLAGFASRATGTNAGAIGSRVTNAEPNTVALGRMYIITNDFVSGLFYTNSGSFQRAEVSSTVSLTNILSTDFAKMALWLDQDGDGTFEMQGRNVSVGGVALVAATEMLMGFVQPGAIFCFTNQSGGTAVATIVPNSSMWVKQ